MEYSVLGNQCLYNKQCWLVGWLVGHNLLLGILGFMCQYL
jgi:hypothetical protein